MLLLLFRIRTGRSSDSNDSSIIGQGGGMISGSGIEWIGDANFFSSVPYRPPRSGVYLCLSPRASLPLSSLLSLM